MDTIFLRKKGKDNNGHHGYSNSRRMKTDKIFCINCFFYAGKSNGYSNLVLEKKIKF